MRKRMTFSYLKIAITAFTLCSASLGFAQFGKKGPIPGPTKSLIDSSVPDADAYCKSVGRPRTKCTLGGVWIEAACQCGPPPAGSPKEAEGEPTYKPCDDGTPVTPAMVRNCNGFNDFDTHTCKCKQSDEPTTSTPGQTCNSAQVNQLYSQCSSDVTAAVSSCDNDQDSGIQSAKSQLSDFAVSIGSQVATNKACSGIAKYVGVLNGAVAAFVGYCNSSRDTCIASCKQAVAMVESPNLICYPRGEADENYKALKTKINAQLDKCAALSVKAQQANAAVSNIANTVRNANNCSKATETTADYCSRNPGTPGCAAAPTECADPTVAASNPICFCNQPGAALNPKCTGVVRAGGTNEMGTSTITSTSAASNGMPTFTAGKEEWKPSGDGKGKGGPGEDPGGKKGGRALEAGSAGAGGGADQGGGAGAAPGGGPQVNNGFRGGSGGGGGWGSSGTGGGGGGSGYAGAGGGSGAANGGPDLRQFLPGGKFDPGARGVGGVTGLSGPDGITGPHDNIFRKIKNRYQAQQQTFLGQ